MKPPSKAPYNPPGRRSLSYRIGTQPAFFREMIAVLPSVTIPDGPNQGARPLAALTTRELSDPTIALLYTWACACDIFTFYQERIANEAYLGTATERLSVAELARLVGASPKPGVAAGVELAFRVEDAEGSPEKVHVPAGLQVQSVPEGDGLPQVFETGRPIVARAEWNALRPKRTRPQRLDADSTTLALEGVETGLAAGDILLFLRRPAGAGQPVWCIRILDTVTAEAEQQRTVVTWMGRLGEAGPWPEPVIYALRLRAAWFGNNAPEWSTQPYEVKLANTPLGYQPQDFTNWPGFALPADRIDLDAEYPQIVPGSWMVLNEPTAIELVEVAAVRTVSCDAFTLSAQVTSVLPGLRERIPCGRVLMPGREGQTATLLPDGRVLFTGGRDETGRAVASAQLYNPETGAVTAGADLIAGRWNHTATLLANDTILIAGGENDGGVLASAELYDLSGLDAGRFTPAGSLVSPRTLHRATLLPEGKVLMTGGSNGQETLGTAEIFDPERGLFSGPLAMNAPRQEHSATLYVKDGDWRVLLAGGSNADTPLSDAENFVIAKLQFVAVAAHLAFARSAHTASLLSQSGTVLLAGGRGADGNGIAVSELYSPDTDPSGGTFKASGSLSAARWDHSATALQDGAVLIAGGQNQTEPAIGNVEAYDPIAGIFRARVALEEARTRHTATLLSGGAVVMAGGRGSGGVLDSIQSYDPAVNTFVPTGAMPVHAGGQAAALLENGYVLVTGGYGYVRLGQGADPTQGSPLFNAAVYDSRTGLFTAAGAMNTARAWHTETLLGDAGILVAGGELSVYEANIQAIIDMLNKLKATIQELDVPVADIIAKSDDGQTQLAKLEQAMENNYSTGNITVTFSGSDYKISATYYYDPNLGIEFTDGGQDSSGNLSPWTWAWNRDYWTIAGEYFHSTLAAIRSDFTEIIGYATDSISDSVQNLQKSMLEQVDAIIAALEKTRRGPLFTAEVFDPSTGRFAGTNGNLNYSRQYHTATLLPTGKVLLAGGLGHKFDPEDKTPPKNDVALDNAELYDPGSGEFTPTAGSLQEPRYQHTATLLANGLVLIAGGVNEPSGALRSAALYDPTADQFSPLPEMPTRRYGHSATLLPGGQVLLAGGIGGDGMPLDNADIFYPATGAFGPVANMLGARAYPMAALLPDGTVLVAGGQTSGATLPSAVRYDPLSGSFSSASDMQAPRVHGVMQRLPDGSVLVAGGLADFSLDTSFLATAEMYVAPREAASGADRRDTIVFAQSAALPLAPEPISSPIQNRRIVLDTFQPDLAPGQKLILTGIPMRLEIPEALGSIELVASRSEAERVQPGERLRILAIQDDGNTRLWYLRDRRGRSVLLRAPAGTLSPVPPDPDDPPASELIEIADVRDAAHDANTVLTLTRPLRRSYDRATVTLSANVVHATQGETVAGEILGSGTANLSNQVFTPRKEPLVYLPETTAQGSRSTLAIHVDDVAWREIPTLYEAGPRDQIYMVTSDLQGRAIAMFGDGKHGARLPQGVDNVVATYRTGVTAEGNVAAHRLTVMPSPPKGLADVTNPMPATGGSPPEPRNAVRRAAPIRTTDLGRVLTLGDFTTFALNFAGIAKARAELLPGPAPRVHLTVAGEGGGAIEPGSDLYEALVQAIQNACEPGLTFQVGSYEPRRFRIAGTLLVDPRRDAKDVLARAMAGLERAFGFAHRDFAEGVAASDVSAVVQAVRGVVAVDLTAFHYAEAPARLEPYLTAALARRVDGALHPAELLLIDRRGIALVTEAAP